MQHQIFDSTHIFDGLGAVLIKRLAQINTRIWEQFADQQLAAVALQCDAGVNELRLISQAQSLNDIIVGQAQLAQEYAERVMAHTRRTVSVLAVKPVDFVSQAAPAAHKTPANPAETAAARARTAPARKQ